MFREYPKAEVEQICAELGIKQRILSDWISRHNLARKRDAAAREADARPAAANCCLCLKLAN
ncbi:hypothetical protein PHJA_002605000 [Phtheirospermum japonicum]|uniref:Uncharacterized protein n=1 Tax=Phtheirospermum japonicum TaxID=374723 RepID=A0A830CXH6_9LAMI|nr:hypothetical protein PHJA_002605000 [Phtheirospermum japonicum]